MAKVRIDGDSRGAQRALKDLGEAADKLVRKYDNLVDSTKQQERAALSALRNLQTPQEKFNRTMEGAGSLMKQNKITMEQYSRVVAKAKQELRDAGKQQSNFLGMSGNLKQMASSWIGIGAAIRIATQAIQEHNAAMDEAAGRNKSNRRDLAKLAQLPNADELFKLSERLYAQGVGESLGEAGSFVFGLSSAGMLKESGFLGRVQATGLADLDKDTLAAVNAFRENFGVSAKTTLSKGVTASANAPSTIPELLAQSARSVGSAKALGFGLEESLAATAILANLSKDAGLGGTQAESLFKSLEKSKLTGDLARSGTGLVGMIDAFKSRGLDIGSFEDVSGFLDTERSEAIKGFRGLYSKRDVLSQTIADIRGTDDSAIEGKVQFLESHPGFRTDAIGRRARAAKELAEISGGEGREALIAREQLQTAEDELEGGGYLRAIDRAHENFSRRTTRMLRGFLGFDTPTQRERTTERDIESARKEAEAITELLQQNRQQTPPTPAVNGGF